MINYHAQMVSALKAILPTYYELALTSNAQVPCISYQERNNYSANIGDTIGYSILSYTVKVWGHDIEALQNYAIQIDNSLRELGFKRTSAQELYDYQSTMIQKILTYEALASENFN
jgi:hypothetical protein